jgi:hypothetical protein
VLGFELRASHLLGSCFFEPLHEHKISFWEALKKVRNKVEKQHPQSCQSSVIILMHSVFSSIVTQHSLCSSHTLSKKKAISLRAKIWQFSNNMTVTKWTEIFLNSCGDIWGFFLTVIDARDVKTQDKRLGRITAVVFHSSGI